MRVVADTNTIVSGSLWQGNPRRILNAARDGLIELYTTRTLLVELEDVLTRDRFAERLLKAGVVARVLVRNFASVATLVEPEQIEPVVLRDPDDDAVIACALSAGCDVIVSGDKDLLDLREHNGIRILTATELLEQLNL